MKKIFCVHLHSIEDSYSFGAFDNAETLLNAVESQVKVSNHIIPFPRENLIKELNSMELEDEYIIGCSSPTFGWSLYFHIYCNEINKFSTTDEVAD